MAQIAIPIALLGGLYILANNDKDKLENFENQDNDLQNKHYNLITNQEGKPKSTVKSESDLNEDEVVHNAKSYLNPNNHKDKYFFQNSYKSQMENEDKNNNHNFELLNGETINVNDFNHNNKVPNFGSRVKGASVDNSVFDTMLDVKQGAGSQFVEKKEIGNLFTPEENMQWANGMPNMSDFYMSRVNASNKVSNIKPWEEERIAPGLNQGYTTQGTGGFNSGMNARDSWMPKNVDDLRVKTNPKESFSLENHQGPANHYNKQFMAKENYGKVEKQLPDTYYNNNPDRWLTTTGLEKGQTNRSIQEMGHVNRTDTTVEYYGNNNSSQGDQGYAPQNFVEGNRNNLPEKPITNAIALNKSNPTTGDYAIKSYKSLPNNRNTTQVEYQGNAYGARSVFSSTLKPIIDILRPSRKENVIGNIRETGNVQQSVAQSHSIFKPYDKTKVTNREIQTTKLDFNHLNYERQSTLYANNNHQSSHTQRTTTSKEFYAPAGGATNGFGAKNYDNVYNQRNNVNKDTTNRLNHGNAKNFNNYENISVKTNETDRNNNRMWVPTNAPKIPHSSNYYGNLNTVPQQYDQNNINERMNPDILTAFKNNPYTQSLSSIA
tara:strand:- start:710 stop:2524 length:1815 start_codon:yes stop_codon:yes gene_type:complete